MRILGFSDTHGLHRQFLPSDFEGVDMLIFAGDCSNKKSPTLNEAECRNFLEWYDKIPVKYKIFVAGNHDTSIEAGLVKPEEYLSLIYLEHQSVIIEGIKIFGSPYVKKFGNWAFMKKEQELHPYWGSIPKDTDILITHGPPYGILDLGREEHLEYCGDRTLRQYVEDINPKHMLFGHVHNTRYCLNAGSRTVVGTIPKLTTVFHNVSCATDEVYDRLTSKGIIIDYEKNLSHQSVQ